MVWFWFLYLPGLLLSLWSLRGERRRAEFYRAAARGDSNSRRPPATVIVPVKGEDEGIRENLASLATLDYADYELIVVARRPSDIPTDAIPARARLVIAGETDTGGSEKISNLLAAVEAARPESEVFAFADSDGQASPGWLSALVAPLERERVAASTGYRWYAPMPPDFPSMLRSAWNAGIFGQFGPAPAEFAWGGAMAIRRDMFERLRVPEYWKAAVTDDYSLSAAVRAAGLEIAYAPGAVIASTDHIRLCEFFRWARRQLVITRAFRPDLWRSALFATGLYCLTMAACVAAMFRASLLGEYAFIAALLPAMLKGAHRSALARTALPLHAQWFKRFGWAHAWLAPVATWVWLFTLLSSAWGTVIEWRGRRYRVRPLTVGKL